MTYVVDIDGTICTNTNGDYEKAQPFPERIQKINKLYDEGHTIVYLTARGMGRYKDNHLKAHLEFWSLTNQQLNEWGAKHHRFIIGKPSGDYYIDDKGVSDVDFFTD
jgi:hypothetical protein